MNLLPPAIQAAILRSETGLPGGGGLPSSTDAIALQFSQLAQVLAGSGPGIGSSRYTADNYAQPSSAEDTLPSEVRGMLPPFLQPEPQTQDPPLYGLGGILPEGVNGLLPVYLQQQPLRGSYLGPEPALPGPIDKKAFAEAIREQIRRQNAAGTGGILYQVQPGGNYVAGPGYGMPSESVEPAAWERLLGAMPPGDAE